MSIWNNEQVINRLLELKEDNYTESEIAQILSDEFNESASLLDCEIL